MYNIYHRRAQRPTGTSRYQGLSKAMSIKSTLLADFDADIEKATGYDKQDLQVVRALIDRTEDTDQKTFMNCIRSTWTLGEKDAYMRATEWKRNQKK